jgi:chitinase
MTDYVGADPGGRPPPDLSTVPPAGLTLAFANDAGGGNFQPQWDPSITPEVIAQLQQQGEFYISASLGGDANYGPWVPPSDPAAWISNATASLSQLMDTYGIDFLDIDYEGGPNGLDDTFVECMSQVIINIGSPERGTVASIAPFGGTLPAYQALWEQCSTFINVVNYQAYADGIPDVQGYLDLYAGLAQQFNGYSQLGLGIASSTSAPRGLQPPDIYTVYENLLEQGMSSWAIWCAEDSVLTDPPYAIENTLISIANGGG